MWRTARGLTQLKYGRVAFVYDTGRRKASSAVSVKLDDSARGRMIYCD